MYKVKYIGLTYQGGGKPPHSEGAGKLPAHPPPSWRRYKAAPYRSSRRSSLNAGAAARRLVEFIRR